MALRTQPMARQDAMASWWPSRYGADDQTGALNCKLHGLDNLYVVDSSFFVSSTAVNPTLTIIANALRIADHIAGRLGATGQAAAQPLVTAHA
jgi:choline dehydrogenase-like flavoprotein